LQPHPAEARGIAAGQDVPAQRRGTARVEDHQRRAAAGHAELRNGPNAEDQKWGKRHQQHHAAADHQGRHQHIARAADHARERIHEPQNDVAGERDVGIGQRGFQRGALAPHGAIKRPAEDQHEGGEEQAERQVDDHRMKHQRVGVIVPPGTQRPGHGRGNAAAHGPTRDHPHQHHRWKHQRHAGERIGAKARDPPGLDQPGRGLRQHDQDVRPSHAQQHRHDRVVQQAPGARAHLRRRARRGGAGAAGAHAGIASGKLAACRALWTCSWQ
jgi:hypothetical protein